MRTQFLLIMAAMVVVATGCQTGSNDSQNSNVNNNGSTTTQSPIPNVNVYNNSSNTGSGGAPSNPSVQTAATPSQRLGTEITTSSTPPPSVSGSGNSNTLPTTAATPAPRPPGVGTSTTAHGTSAPRKVPKIPNVNSNIRRKQ
jgi:hypothetical protein